MTGARPHTVTGLFELSDLPETTRALSGMAAPDYVDLFVLTTTDVTARSPEWRARTALEDVAGLTGQFNWRVLLGLCLAWRAAPHRMAGWAIAGRGESWGRLRASSWLMTAHLLFQMDDGRVSMATFIHYRRSVAVHVWTPLSVVHRRGMPRMLHPASRIDSRDRGPGGRDEQE